MGNQPATIIRLPQVDNTAEFQGICISMCAEPYNTGYNTYKKALTVVTNSVIHSFTALVGRLHSSRKILLDSESVRN